MICCNLFLQSKFYPLIHLALISKQKEIEGCGKRPWVPLSSFQWSWDFYIFDHLLSGYWCLELDYPAHSFFSITKALAVGRDVIHRSAEIQPSNDCHLALMRMRVCPHCQGLPKNVKPCNSLCLNVMKGCLSQQVTRTTWFRYEYIALNCSLRAFKKIQRRVRGSSASSLSLTANKTVSMAS